MLNRLAQAYGFRTMFIAVFSGALVYFVDSRQMRAKRLERETRFARIVGLGYMIGGPMLWLGIHLVLRWMG
ncbi:MAG: hypothetical protein PHV61_06775 [Limnochordia bacterium]|jgi:hypothetical protein|nr:hypothetical protein [Limnochordia bacterium]MDD2629848.1 hypothetical protein [Limnochordia bacterium]MDD4518892.1 hypothetical protein [Limnochordia bacterium]